MNRLDRIDHALRFGFHRKLCRSFWKKSKRFSTKKGKFPIHSAILEESCDSEAAGAVGEDANICLRLSSFILSTSSRFFRCSSIFCMYSFISSGNCSVFSVDGTAEGVLSIKKLSAAVTGAVGGAAVFDIAVAAGFITVAVPAVTGAE